MKRSTNTGRITTDSTAVTAAAADFEKLSAMTSPGRPWTYVMSVAVLLLGATLLTASAMVVRTAHMHEEGGAEERLLSTNVVGEIELSPDASSLQWSNARMVQVNSMDGVSVNVMSVHNDTYVAFLIQRPVNTSVSQVGVGVAIAFEGAGANGSDDVWAWMNGSLVLPVDSGVVARSKLGQGDFAIVFGRALVVPAGGA